MINPDKYIRKAYVDGLTSATGLGVYDNGIPIPANIAKSHIVLSNQSKEPFSRDKCGYEWLCRIDIDIYAFNPKGFSSSVATDDIEEQVLTFIESGFNVGGGFDTKMARLIDTYNFAPVESDTHTINRKRVIVEHWLNYLTT